MELRIDKILDWCGGVPDDISAVAKICSGVSIDTRTIRQGELFVALKGERFDGHIFVEKARQRGAAAAIVEADYPGRGPGLIRVQDTVKALGDIARGYRLLLSPGVIGVTGSDGKTTAREMIIRALAPLYRVTGTEGNQNNHIGLPLSILRADPEADICVLEMGMNSPGEIRYLGSVALPDAAVITNIGMAHVGLLGSAEAIADAKSEIFEYLQGDRTAFINRDDAFFNYLCGRPAGPIDIVSFGMGRGADVRGIIEEEGDYHFSFRLEDSAEIFRIDHWNSAIIYPVLAAIAVAGSFGVSRAAMLDSFSGIEALPGRGLVHRLGGLTLIDETYNANPVSMKAAVGSFSSKHFQRKIVLLGDMAELGVFSESMHRDLGLFIGGLDIDMLITLGTHSRFVFENACLPGRHFNDAGELCTFLEGILARGDALLLKGSRSMHLEAPLRHIIELFGG